MPPDRPQPIRQILRCSRLLREGWHSKGDLAERLGVTERSIKRYLAAVAAEDDDFEVREVDERGLREYRIRPYRMLDRRRGSPYEVLALAMAERFFRAFNPGGVANLLDQMLYEMTGEDEEEPADDSDTFDPVDRARRSLGRRFVLARAPQPLPGRVRLFFDRVLKALVEQRVVDLSYHPRKGPVRDYVLRPYTLLLGEHELAVIGAVGAPPEDGVARPEDSLRTFALGRVSGIKLRTQRFRMPHLGLWDPDARFATAWGLYAGDPETVRVRVHPAFADLVEERRWHTTQRVDAPDVDGWIPLRFDVFPGGELRSWLLSWGPWLQVDEPVDLRRWVERMRSLTPGEGEPDERDLFRIA